jgi:hypothetical protein
MSFRRAGCQDPAYNTDAERVLTGPQPLLPVLDEKSSRPGIRPRTLHGLHDLHDLHGKTPLTSRCSPARHTPCIFIRRAGI